VLANNKIKYENKQNNMKNVRNIIMTSLWFIGTIFLPYLYYQGFDFAFVFSLQIIVLFVMLAVILYEK
jgi:uncharacterized membrane protein